MRLRVVSSAFSAAYGLFWCVLASGVCDTDAPRALLLATGIALMVGAVVPFLPWGYPRDAWSATRYWVESVALALPLAAVAVSWLLLRPQDVLALPPRSPGLMLVVAVAAAAGLVALSGIRVRGLIGGDLAFLAGPLPRHRAAARAMSRLVGAGVEEVCFRGLPLAAAAAASPYAVVLALIAFVAQHHTLYGGQDRLVPRVVAVEVVSGLVFLGLTAATGSILLAVIAHLLVNVVPTVVDVQRVQQSEAAEEDWL